MISDPTTGFPFPGNQIPVSRYDRPPLNTLKYLLAPTTATGLVFYPQPSKQNYDDVVVRVDEKVGHNSQGFLPIVAPHFGGIWQDVQLLIVPRYWVDDRQLLAVGDPETGSIRLDIPLRGPAPLVAGAVDVRRDAAEQLGGRRAELHRLGEDQCRVLPRPLQEARTPRREEMRRKTVKKTLAIADQELKISNLRAVNGWVKRFGENSVG